MDVLQRHWQRARVAQGVADPVHVVPPAPGGRLHGHVEGIVGWEQVGGERGESVAEVGDPGSVGGVPGREGEGAAGDEEADAICTQSEVSTSWQQER